MIPTIAPLLLPRLMRVLRDAFPNLRLFVRGDVTKAPVERLAGNRVGLLPVALPCECGDAETLAIARDEFVVALPKGHRPAARARVPAAALAGSDAAAGGRALPARPGAGAVRRGGRAGGVRGDQPCTPWRTMVAGGLGVTPLPRMAVDAGVAAWADVGLRPLAGSSAWCTIGLAWRRRSPRADEYRALAPLIEPPA